MNYKLYRIETYGMKNIKDLVTIDFLNQTIDNKSSKKSNRIKAIYGSNGAGKSAIINSVKLYKLVVLDRDYLKQNDVVKKLNDTMNHQLNEFYFGIIFQELSSNKISKYQLKIKLRNNLPFISEETLSLLDDSTINGKYKMIYHVDEGNLTWFEIENEFTNHITDITKNLLTNSTLLSFIYNEVSYEDKIILNSNVYSDTNKHIAKQSSLVTALENAYMFPANSLSVYSKDDFEEREIFTPILYMTSGEDRISKLVLDSYKSEIKKLTKFIKLFKPDFKEIYLDITESRDYYFCKKKMVYDAYTIDLFFESTGIKKLIDIFSSIEAVVSGKNVFIDELDSNISCVYLNKLLEYLNDLQKGQLCFTTHSLYPMTYLYKYTNSICFLGETGKMVTWVKNGNYRPYLLYPEGMIDDSPFNIESFEFGAVFEAED